MRILLLSQLVPYPVDSGAKIRLYYSIRHLSRRHQIHLLAFSRTSDTPASLSHLREFCTRVETVPMERSRVSDLMGLVSACCARRSFLLRRNLRSEMFGALQETLLREGPFDAIHSDQIWMAPYALRAAELQKPRPLTILDRHNALFRILREVRRTSRNPLYRVWLGMETAWLEREELRCTGAFDRVVWVNDLDRRAFATQPESEQAVAGFPIHSLIPISVEPLGSERSRAEARRVTFVGGLHWPPNRDGVEWFVRKVWPLVVRESPQAVLQVVGDRPGKLSRSVRKARGVRLLGYQPSLEDCLLDTAVFIVPLLSGSGTRVKILDAWNRSLAVVSTSIGAEGMQAHPKRNILIADSPSGFARAVVSLLKDRPMATALGREGRRTVEECYDWRANYGAWDQIYNEDSVLDTRPSQPDPGPSLRVPASSQ